MSDETTRPPVDEADADRQRWIGEAERRQRARDDREAGYWVDQPECGDDEMGEP